MDCSLSITVRFTAPGVHCWPDAPDHRSYLRAPHRHLFHVELTTPVTHRERQTEFHDLMDEARALFGAHDYDASCETMAAGLAKSISERYEGRPVTVSVFEDGEAGATATLA